MRTLTNDDELGCQQQCTYAEIKDALKFVVSRGEESRLRGMLALDVCLVGHDSGKVLKKRLQVSDMTEEQRRLCYTQEQ